jgi:hypothetical protein
MHPSAAKRLSLYSNDLIKWITYKMLGIKRNDVGSWDIPIKARKLFQSSYSCALRL